MMKRTLAAILALSLLALTACGHMPEQIGEQSAAEPTELTAAPTSSEETETLTDADTAADTTKTSEQKADTTAASDTDAATTAGTTTGASAPTEKDTAASTAGTTHAASTGSSAGGHSGGSAGHSTTKAPVTTTRSAATTKASTKSSTTTTAKATTTTEKATTAATAAPTTEPPTTEPPTEPPVAQDGTTKIVNGVMVVHSGTDHPRALELFSGNFNNGTRYAQTLNAYKAALGDAVNVWCMVVPTSQAFYTPESEAANYGNQQEHYNNIASNFDGVTGVPVYEVLDAHKEEQIYSRTDYHWQPLAAYYAAEQFAAYAGVPYAPLDTYTPVVRDGYLGAFYRVNNVSELGSYPEQFTYYKPANLDTLTCTYYNTAFGGAHQGSLFFENNSINASYTVFVGTDECILETDTNVDNGRVLVIFKDSYGNALVPFLTQSFSKIYLCDFRYFDRNAISFIQEVGATDLLFAMSTVAVCTSSKVDMVYNNMYK